MKYKTNEFNIIAFPFLLVFFEMLTYLSSDMYLPALPTVQEYFSLSHAQAQMTLTSWFLGAISVQLLLGPIADRYGRKIILCSGSIIFTLASIACAATTHYETFLIARFVQGMGICFMAVPGYATIHELFEQTKAIKILALMASITVIAPALGPLLGGIILQFTAWQWIFGYLAVFASISSILLIYYMPETLSQRHPLEATRIIKTYASILGNTRFLLTVTLFGLLFCGFITWIVAGPFLVIDQFHLTPIMFGIFQALIFISNIIANQTIKRIIDRVGAQKLVQTGIYTCLGVSIFGLGSAYFFPNFLIGIIITYVIYSFGSGLAFSPLNRLTIEASNEPMGSRMAVFSTIMSGYATLSSILVSAFYQNTLLSLAGIMAGVMFVAFILNIFWLRRYA